MYSQNAGTRSCIYQENETGEGNVKASETFPIDPLKSDHKNCTADAKNIMKILPGNC